MAVILNASTSSGFVQSADTSGEIVLQNNGNTRLTVNASGVNIPSLTATTVQGTIVQGTAVASTSGTSIDFTSIPSWAKRITVLFNGVSTNGTSAVQIQLGDSGGIETTGYAGVTLTANAAGNAATAATAGALLDNGTAAAAAAVRQGTFIISNISGNIWQMVGNYSYSNTTIVGIFSYTKELSATLDRVRITTVGGTDTFDAGTINIQYEG
jgi:hypothetical protein